jgi:hypothetical protein
MNELDSLKWAQQQLENLEFRHTKLSYNRTQINQYTQYPYTDPIEKTPFYVTLLETTPIEIIEGGEPYTPTYAVTVNDGYVVEKNVTQGVGVNALFNHLCNNLGVDPPEEFDIAVDEAVFVYVPEDEYGQIISANVEIQVHEKDKASLNYFPYAQNGEYYYKLAELIDNGDDTVSLVPYLMGSHIFHHTGLTADVRWITCIEYDIDGSILSGGDQLKRLSFISGMLASTDDSIEERDLATTQVTIEMPTCTSGSPYSMP